MTPSATQRLFGRLGLALCLGLATLAAQAQAAPERVKILFLGDNGHHTPPKRASELMPALARAGIDLAYTDDLADLNSATLDRYDALVIYANHTEIKPAQEQALIDFVEGGKGLVVLHCGSYCFLNSPKYIALVGGQFKSHGGEVFGPVIDKPDHPALAGVKPYEAWDETYVHTKLSDDRLVLMHREAEDGREEPWTWVRDQGKGRVFYTASGHDERVFTDPEFQQLVVSGIKWAARKGQGFELPALAFRDAGAKIPHYVPADRWGVQGKPTTEMQEPLSPAESQLHLSLPGGFKAELFAAEPDIAKVICTSFDDRGRLWVAETVDYPNEMQPPGKGRDRIKIVEDTDGDGKADRFTVFADELSIPTSMVHVPGGLIVTQAPDVLFFADRDGDDKADERRVLFTGFGIEDTHAGPSNMRLGFDGWIYATCGYSGFRGEVGGQRHRFGQSLFRFRPDGSALEVLTSTSNNTWGLGITETNEVVYSTANGEHSSYLGMPNRYVENVRGWLGKGNARMADHDRIHPIGSVRQVDVFGGFTAAAGHTVYTARQFPPDYWNSIAFICEPTGHVVHQVKLERQGSHMVSHDRFNLLASTDEWTSPVVAEIGPDGTVWVSDWYNYIVQHNPTPLGFETGKGNAYETPLRDKTHGRLYRVINADTPLGQGYNLASMKPAQLVDVLKSDNMLWRMKAQWKLVAKKATETAPALSRLVADRELDATGESPAALHALWTLHGLGLIDAGKPEAREVIASAIAHPAPAVRRAAVDVMPRGDFAARAILDAKLLEDSDPLVRRSALYALAECEPSEAAGAAIAAMLRRPENAGDRWIPLAATTAGATHDAGFLAALLAQKDAPESIRDVARIVAEHYARGDQPSGLETMIGRIDAADPALAEAVLTGLAAGWPEDRPAKLGDEAQEKLLAAMGRLGAGGQLQLATLAKRWGLEGKFAEAMKGLRESLAAEVADADKPEADRVAAARRLARMQPSSDELSSLLDEVNPRATPTFAGGLLEAIGQAEEATLGTLIVERWGQFTPALRKKGIEVLLSRPEWSRALVSGLEGGQVGASDLAIDQAQRLSAHPDKAIAESAGKVLAAGGRMPSPDRQKVLTGLLPITVQTGNATKGRQVFADNCAKCHKHGDLGENIGPNLSGFNVHPKEKILTEIIDPNRSVEGNYRQYTVATADGQVFSGLLASENKTAIELVDGEAKRHVVLRDDIDEMIASPKSLMPEGFEKQITPEQFADLLEFLAAKGKFVPIPLEKAATIVTTKGMFYDEQAPEQRLVFEDWSPKTFRDVPFVLVDPRGDRVPNAIMLRSRMGEVSRRMPEAVTLPCNAPAKVIHLLGGVGGWAFPFGGEKTVSMVVRLHYADGQTEDHELRNGVEVADYIRRVDVPGSEFAFNLRGQQLRYLAIQPRRDAAISEIEFLKGRDATAPVVMAVTVETP